MREKKLGIGFAMIMIAINILGTSLGLIPEIPWIKIIFTFIFVCGVIYGLKEREFFTCVMCLCILAWMYEEYLGISDITPFPLFIAGIFLAIGLNMIIGKKKKIVNIQYKENGEWKEGSIDDVKKEEWTDGRHVSLENNFNSTSKYVNSAAFSSAKLENNFGSANVYFNNATIANGEATIDLENNFGKMNIYLPGKWRATISQNSTFGHVGIFGEPNRDMEAPHVIIKAESNFGELNIFFD